MPLTVVLPMRLDQMMPMDQVIHRSGWLFVVKVVLDADHIIAHPKYDLRCKPAQRKSNPVAPDRNNRLQIPGAIPFGNKDYLLFAEDITDYQPSFFPADQLLTGTEQSAATRAAAYCLVDSIGNYIDPSCIGITGSLATGNALDNYSDIDLVLSQEHFDRLAASDFWQNDTALTLRTREQWVDFYHHYGVLSQLSAEEFAEDAARKRQQFVYCGIPVSIFTFSEQDKFLALMDSCKEQGLLQPTTISGTVLFDASGTLPGYSILHTADRAQLLVNFHRTYQGSLKVGTACTVKGFWSDSSSVLWVYYDDQCAIWAQ